MPSLPWVDAIKARAEKASPAPWTWSDCNLHHGGPVDPEDEGGFAPYLNAVIITDSGFYPPHGADKPFIAHAREDIPRLLRVVEVLGEAVEREAVKECEHTRNKTRVCAEAGHPPLYWCNPCRARRALADVQSLPSAPGATETD